MLMLANVCLGSLVQEDLQRFRVAPRFLALWELPRCLRIVGLGLQLLRHPLGKGCRAWSPLTLPALCHLGRPW